MDEKLFTIQTRMETKDYRKFLYLTSFLKSKFTLILIIVTDALFAGIVTAINDNFSIKLFIFIWLLFIIVEFVILTIKIEFRYKQRIKTDRTGIFDELVTLDFYNEFILTYSPLFDAESKLKYSQIYRVLESREYLITYLNRNQASLIRKKDIDDTVIDDLIHFYKEKMSKRYKRLY